MDFLQQVFEWATYAHNSGMLHVVFAVGTISIAYYLFNRSSGKRRFSAAYHAAPPPVQRFIDDIKAGKMEHLRTPPEQSTDPRYAGLFSSLMSGNTKAVQDQLAAGADANTVFKRSGMTPLEVATIGTNVEVVKALLAQGADPKSGSPMLLAVLFFHSTEKTGEVLKALASGGADPNQSDAEGRTPLETALLFEKWDLAKLLLAMGADPMKGSPLSTAVIRGSPEIVRALIAAGADPNEKFQQKSHLWIAAGRGNLEVVKALLEAGADPNYTDETGQTLLMAARLAKLDDVVLAIMESGGR